MQSRVGGTAISVPPEVSLNLVDIPKSTTRVRGKDVPKFTAEIKGPKGMCGALLGVDDLMMGAKLILFYFNCRRDVSYYSFVLGCELRCDQLKSYAVYFGLGAASPAGDVGCVLSSNIQDAQ
jgi:hypothetical protein